MTMVVSTSLIFPTLLNYANLTLQEGKKEKEKEKEGANQGS